MGVAPVAKEPEGTAILLGLSGGVVVNIGAVVFCYLEAENFDECLGARFRFLGGLGISLLGNDLECISPDSDGYLFVVRSAVHELMKAFSDGFMGDPYLVLEASAFFLFGSLLFFSEFLDLLFQTF
ncbi:hypothetical protein FIU85_21835 (plasmid) [Roseovarius sp. THAF8]|nr:hypothetical protein FIU85_21835 [Roseovarius sp. THAF8]